MNILVVDDELQILSVWNGLFRALGVPIRTAVNGELAIEAMRQEPVDLLITDLRMPVADGFQVLQYIHSEVVPAPVTFVCSGFFDAEANAFERFTIERVIPKPFGFASELKYFREFLAQHP